jgi:hypothetical protein
VEPGEREPGAREPEERVPRRKMESERESVAESPTETNLPK